MVNRFKLINFVNDTYEVEYIVNAFEPLRTAILAAFFIIRLFYNVRDRGIIVFDAQRPT